MVSKFSGFTIDTEAPDWLQEPFVESPYSLESDDDWKTVDESSAQSWQPSACEIKVKPIAIKCLKSLAVFAGVGFFGKLAIAERSGDLNQIRGSQLQEADRSLLVLSSVGAVSCFLFVRR